MCGSFELKKTQDNNWIHSDVKKKREKYHHWIAVVLMDIVYLCYHLQQARTDSMMPGNV